MSFEDLQRAWKSRDAATKLTFDADVVLREVRRNQRQFWATIFWRDVREIGVAFLLGSYFVYHGLNYHDRTDDLSAFACAGVGFFMVLDRLLQHGKRPLSSASLKGCVVAYLFQINHQIWLLRNIFWWYLLPLLCSLAISLAYSTWQTRNLDHRFVVHLVFSVVMDVLIFWGVYSLNQLAVRKNLEPRRKELESLLSTMQQAVPEV